MRDCTGSPCSGESFKQIPCEWGKMNKIILQSIWRGVGHIGFVLSIIGCTGLFVTPFLEVPTYWAGIDFELAHGRWGHWLLLLVQTFGIAILTTCCYLAANERGILKLVLTYVVAATSMCIVRDRTLIAVGNAGPIIVQWDPVTSAGEARSERTYSTESPKPTLDMLLEPVWFFAMPLAPVLVLWGITAESRRLNPANSR